jgi:hypothetical protein
MAEPSPDRRQARRILALAAIAAALGVAGAGLAHSAGSGPRPSSGMVEAMPVELAAGFGVLRREAVAADKLPGLAADMVAAGPTSSLGANPALARHALHRSDGLDVYLVPGRDWLCAVDSEGVGTCNRTAEALAGHVLGTATVGASTARVWGLVPDGPAEVSVLHADGSTVTARVSGNAYAIDTGDDLTAVRWSDAKGEHTIPAAAPPR